MLESVKHEKEMSFDWSRQRQQCLIKSRLSNSSSKSFNQHSWATAKKWFAFARIKDAWPEPKAKSKKQPPPSFSQIVFYDSHQVQTHKRLVAKFWHFFYLQKLGQLSGWKKGSFFRKRPIFIFSPVWANRRENGQTDAVTIRVSGLGDYEIVEIRTATTKCLLLAVRLFYFVKKIKGNVRTISLSLTHLRVTLCHLWPRQSKGRSISHFSITKAAPNWL